ncbi:hypothetical protein [Rariglobus hedericola]|uniref:DUF1826 domain-containing protein n=1 Tax=Rariglobus hedericola TaxID=2597822 RepID=A0A556QGI8_9BACT|nr:hypothetical protein [Rariglobus hedericola]TSJ75731.1 hypothetical protein FPL22_15805 [Rariglobus hedericola]
MTRSFTPPPGTHCIQVVGSFEELVSTPFTAGVNALCWPRTLAGNFQEIVDQLGPVEEITSIDEDDLRALTLSPDGQIARAVLIEDLRLLREHELAPELNCIPGYPKDDEAGPVPTDVYSYHADSANVEAYTFLCSYTVSSSEGLRPEDAVRCADVPETRAKLLKEYGGADDAGFEVFLNENFYDLHYVAKPGTEAYTFGLGNLWRITTDWPGSPVPPCVHRAPVQHPGQPPRLLIIS